MIGIGVFPLLALDLPADEKNRLIFKISGTENRKTIEILACKGHYSDK
jgi:hypothetical protein